jgi:iron complex outermembrane recepter protein
MPHNYAARGHRTRRLALAAIAVGGIAARPPVAAAESPEAAAFADIVVTAQKETQSLQKAAAAITVIGSEELRSGVLHDLRDAEDRIPSARLQEESAATEIYIRGVGSTLDVPMVEPPTVFNLNGISIPREVVAVGLYDAAQIEVLPGPQGTLYGRGSLGGTVNAALNRPGDSQTGLGTLEVGNDGFARVAFVGDVPASGPLTARVGGNWAQHRGFERSGAQSEDRRGVELAGLWKAAHGVSVYLWGLDERQRGYAANLVNKGSAASPFSQNFLHSDPWDDRRDGSLAAIAPLGPIDAKPRSSRATLLGGEVAWDIGAVRLTYLPSLVDFAWHQGYWIGSKPSDFGETIRQTTHELRLAGGADTSTRWLGGAYLYRLDTAGQLFINVAPNLWYDASDVRHHRLEGVSAFGQVTLSVAPRARLVAGGRASFDRRRADGFEPGITFSTDPAAVANPRFANESRWHHADWKLSAELDLQANVLLYATAQTAFQPGTFDSYPGATTPASNLLAGAAGAKTTLADGRLRLNDEFFEYRYRDLLVQAFDAGTGALRLTNAQRVRIRGNQLDVGWRPAPHTLLELAVGYLHARYERFQIAAGNFDGLQLQNAPDWTINVGLAHDWVLSSGATLTARLRARYEDAFWGDFLHSPGLYQAAGTRTDASLTWAAAGRRYSAVLWAKNLENRAVQAAAATANDPGPGSTFLEAPRTYGLGVTIAVH